MSFSKSDLIDEVSAVTSLPKTKVKEVLTAAFDSITAKGEAQIHGFGTFKTQERAARTGRNPKTGEPISIAATTKLTFNATKRKD